MTAPAAAASSTDALPDYAPIPQSARGADLDDQGYYVGRVERNLYWVTDMVYQSAFLTTRHGTNLSKDVHRYMQPPDIALSYPWSHFICGHIGRLATRDDVAVHQQYIAEFTVTTTFATTQSLRLDEGPIGPVHPRLPT